MRPQDEERGDFLYHQKKDRQAEEREIPSKELPDWDARRLGRIRFSFDFFDVNLEKVNKILSKCVVVDVMTDYREGFTEFKAICPSFSAIGVGEKIPLYHPTVVLDGDVTFTKVEES